MKKFACLLVITLISSLSFGTIWLPSIISDNMVLQAQTDAPIWGKAAANSQVSIVCSWDSKNAITVKSDEQGKWTANIKTPKDGKKGAITITCGKETRTISNILIGQVWLCSGQSNMAWTPQQLGIAEEKKFQKIKYLKIRLFTVKKTTAKDPQEDCFGEWVECNTETASQFSAVGYYFGKELYNRTHKPIGLIDSSFGGTPAQAWTSRKALENNTALHAYLAADADNEANKEKYQQEYNNTLKEWKNQVAKAVAAGKPAAKKPQPPIQLREHYKCASLYNAMINPLIPFAIKGAIWYQGESNADNAVGYRTLFPAMIADWRTNWRQGDFPFYFVQLAGYAKTADDWPMLREAQTMALAMPNTGMAVAIDIGDANNIHPKNKSAVGSRLALWAMAKNYGRKNLVCSGPMYKGMKIEGGKIRISFDYANGGLKLAPKAKIVKGFTIAGSDKNFVPAQAKICKDSVLVWSEQIKQPLAVRYGWANWSDCNVYNKQNLPASPFRTDNEN